MKKAVIDIDGVLNNYPETSIAFCNSYLGTSFTTLEEMKTTLTFREYKSMKEKYIRSAFKHDAELKKGAKELIDYLKQKGYLIYIITSRQLFKENQLEKTILWLRKHKIDYDYIYCSIKKDFTIFEKFGYVDFVIEDNVKNLYSIEKINGRADYFNVINSENKNYTCKFRRVTNLADVIKDMEGLFYEFYEQEMTEKRLNNNE